MKRIRCRIAEVRKKLCEPLCTQCLCAEKDYYSTQRHKGH